jgi:hypothetical protein
MVSIWPVLQIPIPLFRTSRALLGSALPLVGRLPAGLHFALLMAVRRTLWLRAQSRTRGFERRKDFTASFYDFIPVEGLLIVLVFAWGEYCLLLKCGVEEFPRTSPRCLQFPQTLCFRPPTEKVLVLLNSSTLPVGGSQEILGLCGGPWQSILATDSCFEFHCTRGRK